MADPRAPTFNLAELQALIRAGEWIATWEATAHAVSLGLDAQADIKACVLALDEGDFYKTMGSTDQPGTWQDVYKPTCSGHHIYMKLRLQTTGRRRTVVIQFKKDQSR